MGNCSSCLGTRRRSVYDDDDDSRLLFDDADGLHYGSFGEPMIADQDEAQESQREFEALQSVVARTSDNMVDVFEIVPQRPNPYAPPAHYGLGIPDNRFAQYQNLLAKLAVADDGDPGDPDDREYPEARIEVYADADVDGDAAPPPYHDSLSAKADVDGPFVGNFADAAKGGS